MPESASMNGWRKHRFEQMAVMVNDRIDDPAEADVDYYVGLEHLDSDSLKIRRWGSPSDVEATKLRFRAGDIIFGRRRVYQRKLAVADFDGICSAHAMVLRAKPDVVLREFLPFFMQSDLFMERAKEVSVGSLSPTINWKTLAKEEFDLPPLEEQRKMVEVLRSYGHSAEAMYAARSKGRMALQAVLQSSYSAGGHLGMVSDVCPFITSGSRGWAKYYSKSGRVFMRITNMRRKSIHPDWSDTKFVRAPDDGEAERTKVMLGDVLVSVTAELGLVTLVTDEFPECHVNQHIAILRPDRSKMVPAFLAYFLASSFGMRQFLLANDQGAKAGLNLVSVGRIQVPIVPKQEQARFCEIAGQVDISSEAIEARLGHLVFQRGALLNHMLRGG